MFTLMVAISTLPVLEGLSTPWPVIMAGTTIGALPLITMYFHDLEGYKNVLILFALVLATPTPPRRGMSALPANINSPPGRGRGGSKSLMK